MQADGLGRSLNFCGRQGKEKGPTASDPRPTKPPATGQQRAKHKQKQQKAPHTSETSPAAQDVRGTRQQRETTTYARRTQHNSPSVAQKRRSLCLSPVRRCPTGDRAEAKGAAFLHCRGSQTREDAFLCVPQLSPRVSASVFLPSVPLWVFPPLSKQRRVKSLPGRAHWWGGRDRLCWRAYTMCRLSPGLLT